MAKKERKKISEQQWYKLLLNVSSAVLSALVLAFSTMTLLAAGKASYQDAPTYLLWVFFFVGLMSIVIFLKDRTRLNLIRAIVLFVFNLSLGIIVQFAEKNPYLFSLTAGLYCLTIIVSRIFKIIQKHTVRSIVLNCLIITLIFLLSIGMFSIPSSTGEQIQGVVLLECIIIAVISFADAASIAFAQLKVKVLFKIMLSTYSLEIIFGLLTLMVCFSLIFPIIEEGIDNFADGLWYSFAVVTTIGFGDITAKTLIGRILTVILGLYGLVVVAVITSIIVNFYNETAGKHAQKELKEIQKEEAETLKQEEKKK